MERRDDTRFSDAAGAFLMDVRRALGGLRHAPGLVAAVVVTLALGVGANTAIFSVVRALLLDPLPYRAVLLEELSRLPGVTAVGGISHLPAVEVRSEDTHLQLGRGLDGQSGFGHLFLMSGHIVQLHRRVGSVVAIVEQELEVVLK